MRGKEIIDVRLGAASIKLFGCAGEKVLFAINLLQSTDARRS